jgi:hypothetical protein
MRKTQFSEITVFHNVQAKSPMVEKCRASEILLEKTHNFQKTIEKFGFLGVKDVDQNF